MINYEKLDALIINAIGGHPKQFDDIFSRTVKEECERLVKVAGTSPRMPLGVPSYRFCDRRVQALRKAGKIRFVKGSMGGWVLGAMSRTAGARAAVAKISLESAP